MKLPFFSRSTTPAETTQPDSVAPSSTETFRQILSTAKALAVHHGLTRDDGDTFHLNLGHGLASRYLEEDRELDDFYMTAVTLESHCHSLAARAFADKAEIDLGEALDSKRVAIIDIYGMAEGLANDGSMERAWGPFDGPAAILWDAGMNGLPRSSEDVRSAIKALAWRAMRHG